MPIVPTPENESARLAALHKLEILDTAPEIEFDALAKAASLVFGAPISLIALLDSERLWFKANVGLEGVSEISRDNALCAYTIMSDEGLVVPDTKLDPRFSENPLVTGAPDIRFYAGAPIKVSEGYRLGTICVIDTVPRQITEQQEQILGCLAQAVATALEGRRAHLEQQRILAEYQRSEAKFRTFFEGSPVGEFYTDPSGTTLLANERYYSIYGIEPGSDLRDIWASLIHPEDRDATFEARRIAMEQRIESSAHYRIIRRDGDLRYLSVRRRPIFGQDGTFMGYMGSVDDTTERALLERSLHDVEERWSFALDNSGQGVWDLNGETGLTFYSPSWSVIFGYEPQEQRLAADAWLSMVHPDDLERVIKADQDHIAGQTEIFDVEFRMRHRDGRWLWIHDRGKVVRRGPDGKVLRMIGTHTDITQRKAIEEELLQAKIKAEAGSRSKSDFLANMSHELRTPLTGIIGAAELLLSDDTNGLNASLRSILELQRDAGRSLLAIVNDVLDFSKMEAGQVAIEAAPFSLLALAHSCIQLVEEQARKKGIALRSTVDSRVPHEVIGDATRIRQVLLNLLTNAIKFTSAQGSIELKIDVDRAGLIRFSVSDTGIGIGPENLDRLFNRFSQGDSSTTRRYGGTGLGLAISKHLVELMKGQISVASMVGKGSTFRVSLPLDPVTTPVSDATGTAPFKVSVPSETYRILLAEDNPMNKQLIMRMIEKAGHAVVAVEDGAQAVDALFTSGETFDLVLMDIQMPVMDGLQATREIRQRLNGQALPIIALTANAFPEEIERCFEAGMDVHLKKPIDWPLLFATIEREILSARKRSGHPGRASDGPTGHKNMP